jgi:hypothetical protein
LCRLRNLMEVRRSLINIVLITSWFTQKTMDR